jgi:hypothetical protein
MNNIVTHFGVHWDDTGVAFLMQGRGSTNALGLRKGPPFEVKLPSRAGTHCNHQIPLSAPIPNNHHWDWFEGISKDPLVEAMLPIPKTADGLYFLKDTKAGLTDLVAMLSRMSSPIYSTVKFAWNVTEKAILKELEQSNIQPLILVGVTPKHSAMIDQISKAIAHYPRKLILIAEPDVIPPSNAEEIETDLKMNINLTTLPWETIGARVVIKWMRREWT